MKELKQPKQLKQLSRLALVAALFAVPVFVACGDSIAAPASATDHAAIFDDLWHQFDLHYSFFELKHINWDSLGAHYRPIALTASNDVAFASALARMMNELHDVHVSLTPVGLTTTMRYVARAELVPTYFDTAVVFRTYVHDRHTTPSGHVTYGLLASDIGYIYLPTFEGGDWASEVDIALRSLAGVRNVVLDIRNNGGGSYGLAQAVAGRFTDRSRTAGYIRRRNGPAHTDLTDFMPEVVTPAGSAQFTGAVLLLTNRGTFSSGESFTLAMRSRTNITVLGDTTGGASGGPIVRELANGWTYQLSEWIEYTPDRRTFEGVGLAPDIVVKPTAADGRKNIDPALDAALALAARQ